MMNLLEHSLLFLKGNYWQSRLIPLVTNIGFKHVCPICGYRFKEYEVVSKDLWYGFKEPKRKELYGAGRRLDGCYFCHATARHRLLYLYLKNELHLFHHTATPPRLLHIAPERILKRKLKRYTDYLAGDFFAHGYSYGKDVMHLDIMKMPFENDRFDLIICIHVLEHVTNDRKAIAELYRVLKPGGIGFIQAPVSPDIEESAEATPEMTDDDRRLLCGQRNHLRLYAMKDYIDRLEQGGFKVEVYRPSEETIEKYELRNEPVLFICRK